MNNSSCGLEAKTYFQKFHPAKSSFARVKGFWGDKSYINVCNFKQVQFLISL